MSRPPHWRPHWQDWNPSRPDYVSEPELKLCQFLIFRAQGLPCHVHAGQSRISDADARAVLMDQTPMSKERINKAVNLLRQQSRI